MSTEPNADSRDTDVLRALLDQFLQERLEGKLNKLDASAADQRQKILEDHQRPAWLADAARRVAQIQLATHTLKPIHPDARGTNIYLRETHFADSALVGTHCLLAGRADDVVGNAAALDVFKFLKLAHEGKSVLARLLDHEPEMLAALSDDAEQAKAWRNAFVGIVESKGAPTSHTLAKQIYFPLAGGGYHMLAPLFPTTLVQHWYELVQADRFSESARDARKARRENTFWPHGYREYPNLAARNFGGSKPQNISQLNSERRGASLLLASMPPIWQSVRLKPPLRQRSVFDQYGAFGRRRAVKDLTQTLRFFLLRAADRNNVRIREARAELVDDILDELSLFAAQIQSLPPNWSADNSCQLDAIESRWLDPGAAIHAAAAGAENQAKDAVSPNWFEEVAHRFANWLNSAISTERTPMGDEEHLAWKILVAKAQSRLQEDLADEA